MSRPDAIEFSAASRVTTLRTGKLSLYLFAVAVVATGSGALLACLVSDKAPIYLGMGLLAFWALAASTRTRVALERGNLTVSWGPFTETLPSDDVLSVSLSRSRFGVARRANLVITRRGPKPPIILGFPGSDEGRVTELAEAIRGSLELQSPKSYRKMGRDRSTEQE